MKTKIKAQKGQDSNMATAPVLVLTPKVEDFGQEFVNKTVLLKVSFGLPGFTKRLKKSNVKVDADEELIKAQKLILDSPEYEAVQKLDNSFRLWLYANFTQFSMGVFIIPVGMVDLVEKKVAEFSVERKKLIKEFAKAYPEQVKAIKPRLRRNYDQNDYPPTQAVLEKFFFSHNYVSFAAPGQLKGINPDIFKREQEKAQKLFQDAAQEFKGALRTSFAEMVKKLQDKLTDEQDAKGTIKQKRIHESAVKKLQDWVNTFDLRNAMNDKELKSEVDKVRKLIGGVDTEALRSTDTVRERIRVGMEQVTAKLETLVEVAPIRKFKFATGD